MEKKESAVRRQLEGGLGSAFGALGASELFEQMLSLAKQGQGSGDLHRVSVCQRVSACQIAKPLGS